jgi:hypothetical protein
MKIKEEAQMPSTKNHKKIILDILFCQDQSEHLGPQLYRIFCFFTSRAVFFAAPSYTLGKNLKASHSAKTREKTIVDMYIVLC